ncbi:tetratricopeptide repeat protein [Asticcacaulis taihuensis]|uniref:tetratricopeptide repeat protein n=1 Tax=Asticcacaulis taihuensis TaxID=260084 RepID=UPI003F7B80E5
MRHKSKFSAAALAFSVMATGIVTSTSGYAQTASPSVSSDTSSAAADAPAPQTITIFGRKREKGDPTVTHIETHDADSCGFMNNYDPANEEIIQDYLKSFYGDYTSTTAGAMGDSSGANEPGMRFKDNSPFGNASEENAADHNTLPGMQVGATDNDGRPVDGAGGSGACGPSDKAFAAGRSYIARKDTSLKEAFAAFDARDYPKALELFRKSYTKMGYDSAALMEGKMYLAGMGTKADAKQAIIWLRKVTETRFSPSDVLRFNPDEPTYMNTRIDAAMTLAKVYMVGLGVPRDAAEARRWYIKADDFGFMPATHTVGQIYEYGYAGEKAPSKALPYYKKAATAGYAPSMYALGQLYLSGDVGVTADPKQGAQWLLEAAKRGHAGALYAVGNMYDLGDVLPHDAQKAVVYYKEAALKGQPDAQDAIGLMFYTGEVVGQDLVMARKWFDLAARQGQPDAMFNLGAMLANGQGGGKDMTMAYVWLKLAQESGVDKAGPVAAKIETKLTPEERARAMAILQPTARVGH